MTTSLAIALEDEPDLVTRLDLAIAATSALAVLHERGVVHKAVQTSHLLVDLPTRGAWLAPTTEPIALPYMAPEQTGRMNRPIDARSDLYSLGIVLYELFAGGLPWAVKTPAEWVHCHVARRPAALPDAVPLGLAAIVEKLLAKSPDERYQTATGLQADLVRARDNLRAGNRGVFALGEHDTVRRLRAPRKAYGRDAELAVLRGAFERVATIGSPELVLVGGPSGIGKSALVAAAVPRISGWYCAGKYDQYKRDIPYATLAGAISDLVRQLLRRPDHELATWRAALREDLDAHLALACDVIPALGQLLGLPVGKPDAAIESKARIHRTLTRVLGALAQLGGVLTVFIDDLQWSDRATLDLLGYFFASREARNVLVIGAYRDNELAAHRALAHTLDAIRSAGPVVTELQLAPLTVEPYAQLLADMLDQPGVGELAALVHEKTGGNPFFAVHFTGALVDDGLLAFDQSWRWDLAQIRERGLTTNVVDLLIDKLQRLPNELRDAAIALACVGGDVAISVLTELLHASELELETRLAPAVRSGMIVRAGAIYRFAHDRVQEAAHRLASPDRLATLHLQIARILRRRHGDPTFELASHYNEAQRLIEDPGERVLAAEANLAAAERARASGAYGAATAYITHAHEFLGETGWETVPQLAARIELVQAYCDHLEARLESAARRLDGLAARSTDLLFLAEVARTRAEVAFARGQVSQALEIGAAFMRQAGITWPDQPTAADMRAEYEAMLASLAGRPVEALADLPEITDPLLIACANVLLAMLSPAGTMPDRNVTATTWLRMITFAIEHGLSPSAALAFARIPETLIVQFGDWDRALGFHRLLDVVVDRKLFAGQRARSFVTACVTADPYYRPFSETRARLGFGRQLALASGDVTYFCIAAINEIVYALGAGEPLGRLAHEARDNLALVSQTGFGMMILAVYAELQFAERLTGETVTEYDPQLLTAPGNLLGVFNVRARELMAATYLGDHEQAIALIEPTEPLEALAGVRVIPQDFRFSAALSLLALDRIDEARRHVDRFIAWGQHGLQNFLPRIRLLEAEVARVERRFADAGRLYDEAISAARERKLVHDEGLAAERAAQFYATRRSPLIATTYHELAIRAWIAWGAHGKLRRVDPGASLAAARPEAVRGVGIARIATMAQAVTSEIDLDRLVDKLLALALAEGGAVRGRIELVTGASLTTWARTDPPASSGDLVERAVATKELVHDDTRVALPFVNQGRLIGLAILEADRPFALSRLSVLATLAGLAATALEHARLYADLRAAEAQRAEAERLARTGSFGWSSWSEQALAIFGYGPGERGSLTDRAHPDDRARIEQELARIVLEPHDLATEYRIVLPDGSIRHVHVQIRALGEELSGAIVDVTETKQLQLSLDASREFYAVMLASIADGVIVTDETHRVTFMNRAAEALTGWSHETAIGRPYAAVIAGASVPLEEQRALLADDASNGAVTIVRDAGHRRAAARIESAALVNERIGRALRGSGVGIWWMQLADADLASGHLPIHSINLWESLGWDTGEDRIIDGVRQSHPERVDASDRMKLVEAFRAHVRGDTPNIELVTKLRHRDGQWRYILTRGTSVRDGAGTPVWLTGSSIDITARYQLEADIRTARDAAEAANRAKDEFLANVSHEVRTPMNAILGMTELALSTNLTPEQRPWLATVKSSADNLLVIIDELLDFSKAEANKLVLASEPMSIRDLVADTLRALSVRAQRKQITLVSSVADDVPEVLIGDRTRLHQILTNLVGNAIKFTAVGEVRVAVTIAGELVRLAVSDTGIGIPADKHALIFEPFTQADASTTRRFGGTGLGLTIAARLAALMGGGITVTSEPEVGSTFTVTARLGRTDLQLAPPASPVISDHPVRPLRILVGEDNDFNADLVRELLTRRGHTVVVAVEGHSTLARALTEEFDALLLDIHMPGIDGFEVVRGIRDHERATGAHLPVIALTARSRREDRDRCLAAGMDDFLSKPLQSKLMFEILERLT